MVAPPSAMPQVCRSLAGKRLCLLGEGAEPWLGRLWGQWAVTAIPKTNIAAGKGSRTSLVSVHTHHLPIQPLCAHSLLSESVAEVHMPSLGFRVNTPTSNPSIPQAKTASAAFCQLLQLSSTAGVHERAPRVTEELAGWTGPLSWGRTLRIPRG